LLLFQAGCCIVIVVPEMDWTGANRSVNEFWLSSSIRFCSGSVARPPAR
jgi:hypothetical protein